MLQLLAMRKAAAAPTALPAVLKAGPAAWRCMASSDGSHQQWPLVRAIRRAMQTTTDSCSAFQRILLRRMALTVAY